MHRRPYSMLTAILILGAAATASAQTVLWSDSFNRANSSNLGTNDNALGGTITTGYATDGATISNGFLRVNTTIYAQPQHNFTDAAITSGGGFEISFKLNPPLGSPNQKWGGVSFGLTEAAMSSGTQQAMNNSFTDFGLLLRNNGLFENFADGTELTTGGDPLGFLFDTSLDNTEWYDVRLLVQTSSFADGAAFTVNGWVTGILDGGGTNQTVQLDLNGGTAGLGYNGTWQGANANYIVFESSDNGALFDDIVISAIPEPSAMALVLGGLGLLALVRSRARR